MSISTKTDKLLPLWLQHEFNIQTAAELDDMLDSMEEIVPCKSEQDD
ncbi:hypothetical protein L910_2821 [Vibrio fluvialis PG41]|uniref:Uncharacterized protein n=1 Tax=Vibrio fluvialis PG41 TaxID=1336752 RepID=S7HVR1_VIBFL|nr:hypothetical protein [Vibrio fluvialis]EPP19747.1 hypothetical protein L910_2821 [Vibrio fluvialis PG41]